MITSARPDTSPLPTIPTQRAVRPTPPLPLWEDDPEPIRVATPVWIRWVLLPLAVLVSIGTVLSLVAVGAVQFADDMNQEIQQAVPTSPSLPPTASPATPIPDAAVPTGAPETHAVEEAYLTRLYGAGLGAYGTEAELLDLGYRICDGWNSGMAFGDFVRALTTAGYSLESAGAQVEVATHALCPGFAGGLPGGA